MGRHSVVDVNFVEPSVPGRWAILLLALLAAVALVVWALVGWQTVVRRGVERELLAEKEKLEQLKRAGAKAALPPYQAAAWEVWKRGRFAASEGLAALEAIQHPGITVQSIDVDNEAGTLKVEILATNHDAIERFLDELNAGMPLPNWRLSQASSHANGLKATLSSRW